MLKIKYLGIFPVTVPDSVSIAGTPTVAEVMAPLIQACKMPDDFFWDHHLILINGEQPEMDDIVLNEGKLEILSFSEGG